MKQEKGITLIALAVTILVLLVLAGVTIQAIGGQTGIMTTAQGAGSAWRSGENAEKNKLNDMSTMLSQYSSSLSNSYSLASKQGNL